MEVKIEESWKQILKAEFSKPYFLQIAQFLKVEKEAGKTIFPPGSLIFNAFNTTPFDRVKVVLLGQDPYHGPGQAMGLSFSVLTVFSNPLPCKIFSRNCAPISACPHHARAT